MIVLDTATWIWRASDPKRLTTSARRAIDEAERALVSAISVWEFAILVAKRRIQLDRPVEEWVNIALAFPGIQLAPLEPAIAVRSTKVSSIPIRQIASSLRPPSRTRSPSSRRTTGFASYPRVQSAW